MTVATTDPTPSAESPTCDMVPHSMGGGLTWCRTHLRVGSQCEPGSAATTADEAVTLSRADVAALLGLLLWVHDSILRQPDNDALIRRVGAAMGRLS